MEKLGYINDKEILYCNVRIEPNWFEQLPTNNWIVFTIADNEDFDLINEVTIKCLDKNVCYTCSAGELARKTEDYFDEEIVIREIAKEEQTGEPQNYDKAPMTVSGRNFSEEFWFAVKVAYVEINDQEIITDKVVCIDLTRKKVKAHLLNLVEKINKGWLPSDDEIEIPLYDS